MRVGITLLAAAQLQFGKGNAFQTSYTYAYHVTYKDSARLEIEITLMKIQQHTLCAIRARDLRDRCLRDSRRDEGRNKND